jgi:hypothetical protein
MFDAAGTPAPGRGARDSISLFKGSVKTQITRAEDAKAGKPGKTPALNWFKWHNGRYVVQLGKKPIAIGANKHWEASDLDGVIRLLDGATKLADTDAEFQKNIRDAAKKAEKDKPQVSEQVNERPTRKRTRTAK